MLKATMLKSNIRYKKLMKNFLFCLLLISFSFLNTNLWAFSGNATVMIDGVGSFDVLSFEQNLMQPNDLISANGGGSAQRANFGAAFLQVIPNDAIPMLFLFCAGGIHIPEATINFDSSSIKLQDVIVTSTNWTEQETFSGVQIGLNYGRIYWTYGGTSTGWDLKKMTEAEVD